MLKRTLLLAALGLAALAVATHVVFVGASGHGRATDGHRIVDFQLGVGKATDGTHTLYRGTLDLFQPHTPHQPAVYVQLVHLRELEKTGNVVEFAGAGAMTVRTQTGHQTVHGRVEGRVVDRRTPHHPQNDPDLIAVRFIPQGQTEPVYNFDGALHRGDIQVFERVH
jgi:hypothetical protein